MTDDISLMARKRLYEHSLTRVTRARVDWQQADRQADLAKEKLAAAQRTAIESVANTKTARKRLNEAEAEFKIARESYTEADERSYLADKQ